MITLKRLNNTEFVLNAELIEQIEATPDTVITLTTGNNIVVRESLKEVVKKILDYRRSIQAKHENRIETLKDKVTSKWI